MAVDSVKRPFLGVVGFDLPNGADVPVPVPGLLPPPFAPLFQTGDAYGLPGSAQSWVPQPSLASSWQIAGELEALRGRPHAGLDVDAALASLNATTDLPARPQRRITPEQEQLLTKVIARANHKTGWSQQHAFQQIATHPGITPQQVKALDPLLDGRFGGTSLDADALLDRIVARPGLTENQASALQAIIRNPKRGNDAAAFDSNAAAGMVFENSNLSGAQLRVLREVARVAGARAGFDGNKVFEAVAKAQNIDHRKAELLLGRVRSGRNPLGAL